MEQFKRKSTKDLINDKYHFFIPAYQRGYKWTTSEVMKLLKDIWEFHLNKGSEADAFYCLQPVVVKPVPSESDSKDIIYHVIDGQQRLTTLLIIQQAINDYKAFNDDGEIYDEDYIHSILKRKTIKNSYTIEYETRGRSENWLNCRFNLSSMRKNSDFSHIFDAYQTTLEFLGKIDAQASENPLIQWICLQNGGKRILQDLTLPDKWKKSEAASTFSETMKDRCDVIWYELDQTLESDEDVFDRLNTGKISLNNAELIKALFLLRDNYPVVKEEEVQSEDYRSSIAREWDSFEHQLQNPEFWYFIYDESSVGMSYDSRIEFIFDLIAGKTRKDSDRYYFTFDYYDALFKKYVEKESAIDFVNKEWERVRNMMQTMRDWYDNRIYYHYIGYLISQGHSVSELLNIQLPHDAEGKMLPVPTKTEFIKSLEDLIRQQTSNYKSADLYKSKKGLTPVLLLFNVLTEMTSPNENARYPFHHHKETAWNEEHVAPATAFEPKDKKRCFQFAAEMLEYYTDISYFAALGDIDKRESKKPKDQRKKPKAQKDEAYNTVTELYEKHIAGMDEDKEICERLFRIFKAKGDVDESESMGCYQEICSQFDMSNEQLDSTDSVERDFIWNQVLLDEGTNKSYGNAIFPYKRKRIIMNDSKGIFVPIGTKNVFVKAYSYKMKNMFEWNKTDALRYFAQIWRMLYGGGREFLNRDLLDKDLPEFIDKESLKNMIGYGY